jgi:hypothetical protein
VDDLPDSDKENDSGDGSEGQGERGSTGGVAGKYSRCLWMGKKQATAYAVTDRVCLVDARQWQWAGRWRQID